MEELFFIRSIKQDATTIVFAVNNESGKRTFRKNIFFEKQLILVNIDFNTLARKYKEYALKSGKRFNLFSIRTHSDTSDFPIETTLFVNFPTKHILQKF
ncbi:hypothetical protein RRU94_01405 [Domibacillus sp. DTU_2020_1001157_1_SI_ALB_TIR_016]|uniref:hypothetical protein n=1 Tax=Domibacillus sp. DTU_2020_1001157_1_SI_ALB_TIR_016 TaxID=3077789 RepID=UPI0028E5EE97|nr:hypothetical protein [Domibacillus sp. DTU_2020_1001157_1_SI_ALB_TIR_016]WNS78637.1 hypothetical protein RRU94_01405 [Domibacillus sp. DTU_2020_1001157_1_SI_ALB_TIR_016]